MSKKIVVRENCNACGLCLGCQYLTELPDGKAAPAGAGIVSDNEAFRVEDVMNLCPENAIILENIAEKSKADVIKSIDKMISEFALKTPTKSDLKYEEKYAVFAVPGFVQGEERYEYSSENRALDAARRAIDQAMYSRREQIFQEIITNYKVDKLSPYYVYNEDTSNFYYTANMKAQNVLNSIIGEVRLCKPSLKIKDEMARIKTRPQIEKNYMIDGITNNILHWGGALVSEMSGEYYTLSWYVNNCDTDDYDEYVGKGLFGSDKYVTKYCFRHTKKAFDELAEDIKKTCRSSFDERVVEGCAYGYIEHIVKDYEKALKNELTQKCTELKKLL